MALISVPLMPLYRPFWLSMSFSGAARQAVEVVDVLGAGHFQRQLGVFQREEARRAGDPVQLIVVAVDFLQQVVVDLRRALAAADHRDRALALQAWLVLQVVAAVADVVGQAFAAARQIGRGAGAEYQAAGEELETLAAARMHPAHAVAAALVEVVDVLDEMPEAQAVELLHHPLAVLVVFAAHQEEVFLDVEGVQPPDLLGVVEKAETAGGVGQGHQIGHERRLQGGAVEHHAGMPVEALGAVEEQAVESVDGLC